MFYQTPPITAPSTTKEPRPLQVSTVTDLLVVVNDPAAALADVCDVMARRRAGAHVADKAHQAVPPRPALKLPAAARCAWITEPPSPWYQPWGSCRLPKDPWPAAPTDLVLSPCQRPGKKAETLRYT